MAILNASNDIAPFMSLLATLAVSLFCSLLSEYGTDYFPGRKRSIFDITTWCGIFVQRGESS